MTWRKAGAVFVLGFALGACGGRSLGSAKTAYREGDYVEAKRALVEIEPHEMAPNALKVCEQVEYRLYRGLTHLALGDLPRARDWLDAAQTHDEENRRVTKASCLHDDDQARLRLAREQVAAAK